MPHTAVVFAVRCVAFTAHLSSFKEHSLPGKVARDTGVMQLVLVMLCVLTQVMHEEQQGVAAVAVPKTARTGRPSQRAGRSVDGQRVQVMRWQVQVASEGWFVCRSSCRCRVLAVLMLHMQCVPRSLSTMCAESCAMLCCAVLRQHQPLSQVPPHHNALAAALDMHALTGDSSQLVTNCWGNEVTGVLARW